jgi:transposase
MSTVTRVWAIKGEPLNVPVKQGFKNFYLYSAVCPHTGEDFTLILPGVNTAIMKVFLNELSKAYRDYSIILIMDQAGWHKTCNLNTFENIKIIYLPPYSPELNPVERLWRWIKRDVLHNVVYQTLDQLMVTTENCINSLKRKRLMSLCSCNYL